MEVKHPGRQQQLQKLLLRLGLPATAPVKWHLVDLALTHASFDKTANYEQLEFMGDAVVKLFLADLMWQHEPNGTVGEWTAIRAILVSDRTLAEIAQSYGFEDFLQVGSSALRDRNGLESRLADTLEALVGALYLSTTDLSLIRPWLEPHFQRRAALVKADPARFNYKAALQEWTQAHYQILPEYRTQEIQARQSNQDRAGWGSDRFRAEVWLHGKCLATGTGRSMKAAEKVAAEVAYQGLQNNEHNIQPAEIGTMES